MENLLKQVRLDCNRYIDINNVLIKMVEKSYIQQIQQLFENIFREEQAFTVQELNRLMKNLPKDKYFDMNLQFKMNTQIFKTNFDVVVNSITNNVWNKVQADFLGGNDQSNNNNSNLGQSFTENNSFLQKQNGATSSINQSDHVIQDYSNYNTENSKNQSKNPENLQILKKRSSDDNKSDPLQNIDRVMSYDSMKENQMKVQNQSQSEEILKKNDSWVRKSLRRDTDNSQFRFQNQSDI